MFSETLKTTRRPCGLSSVSHMTCIYKTTHHGKEKLKLPHNHCQGNLIHYLKRIEPPPAHVSLLWQLYFIHLLKSHGYECTLTIICMFFHWLEAFHIRRLPILLVLNFCWNKSFHPGEFHLPS